MAAEPEDPAAFDDEDDDLEDTDADDTDLDDDEVPSASAGGGLEVSPTPNANPSPNPPSDPNPPPQNGAIQMIPISSIVSAASDASAAGEVKRQRIEERRPPPSAALDESRRLFQRLWTDDDEIKILRGFLEFTSSRGTTFASHQYDTGPFYEKIKNELQLDFNKNQLIEKLRRLKKKYRNTANRMANHGSDFSFKSPHEKSTYDIAKKIWSASIKRSGESDDDLNPYSNHNAIDAAMSSDRRISSSGPSRSRRRNRKRSLESLTPAPAATPLPALLPPPPPPAAAAAPAPSDGVVKVDIQTAPAAAATPTPTITPKIEKPSNSSASPIPSVIEKTVKSCVSPIFKELLNSAVSAPLGLGINLPPSLNFGGGNLGNLGNSSSDEKWKQQHILELEVYLKRVELVRDQIKSTLEELKGSQQASGSSS